MPNMVAIVTKIDIQILHLLSQLQCLFFFTELLCGRKRGRGGWWRVEKGGGIFFSCTPYVVSFGGLLVSVYAWQVLAPSLCSWCLRTRLCQHPPALLPVDLAPHGVLPLRHHESEINLETEFNSNNNETNIDMIHIGSSWSCRNSV